MATTLNYAVTLPNGVEVTYWRVTSATTNMDNGSTQLTASAWLNEQSYADGLAPVTGTTVTVSVSQSTLAGLSTNIHTLLQTALPEAFPGV